ncbi:hypothetical protein V8C43DRAFT_271214 [Trichoderma afarasin]
MTLAIPSVRPCTYIQLHALYGACGRWADDPGRRWNALQRRVSRIERPGHGPKTWWLQALVAVNRSVPAPEAVQTPVATQ